MVVRQASLASDATASLPRSLARGNRRSSDLTS
jgi:hypothetical protein